MRVNVLVLEIAMNGRAPQADKVPVAGKANDRNWQNLARAGVLNRLALQATA